MPVKNVFLLKFLQKCMQQSVNLNVLSTAKHRVTTTDIPNCSDRYECDMTYTRAGFRSALRKGSCVIFA